MISGSQQHPGGRPVVDLLNQDRDKPLKFADLTPVVAALCNSVQFVEEENAVDGLGVFQDMTQIAAGSAKQTAHYGRHIKNEKRALEFARKPPRGHGLADARRAKEQ